jgi:hypothetical protein
MISYINSVYMNTLVIPSDYITPSLPYFNMIGGYDQATFHSFTGFMWYFVISDNLDCSLFYSSTSSNTCLSLTSSCSCSGNIINYNNLTGCLPAQTDPTLNAVSNTCPNCVSSGCYQSTCLDCANGSSSCYICMNGYYLQNQQCFFCSLDCELCYYPNNVCSRCKDSNAELNSNNQCVCGSGYYNTSSLSTSGSCYLCSSGCGSCNSSQTCLSCKDPNSVLNSASQCECKSGYYYDSNRMCQPCSLNCLSCSDSVSCIECDGANTIVNRSNFCICKDRYYVASRLPTACNPCGSLCKTCTSNSSCSECIENASLINSECSCKARYYKGFDNICQPCSLNCLSCSDSVSCTECDGANTIVNNSNFCSCKDRYYVASRLPTICSPCGSLCKTCTSNSSCSECAENALLVNSECFCKPRYSEFWGNCIIKSFNVLLSINEKNSITLYFEEPLSIVLSISNLTLTLQNTTLEFTITEKDNATYTITPNYLADIQKNSKLEIHLKPLLSINNSLLNNTFLSVVLFETSYISSQQRIQSQINSAENLGAQGAIIGLSIVIVIGGLHLNLASLFNFINTAEIFYSTVLFNINFDPALLNFLLSIRVQSKLPNFFRYFVTEKKGVDMLSIYKDYGYSTNLFILNAELHIIILTSLLAINFIFFFLSMIPRLKKNLTPILKLFEFRVFLRYWAQTFLDICLSTSLGIRYSNYQNLVQIIDFIFCICVLVSFN